MSMSNLLKVDSWCWIHLIVHTSILFPRILLFLLSLLLFSSRRYCIFSTLNIFIIIIIIIIITINWISYTARKKTIAAENLENTGTDFAVFIQAKVFGDDL